MSKLTAVAYFKGIPPNNNNAEKPLILNNFLEGVRNSGDTAIAHQGFDVVPCDVAFIQGFVHEHGKSAPHLQLRQNAVDLQKQNNKRSLIVDSNLFLYADPGNTRHYLRYSFDGVFPTTGFYFDKDVDPGRWTKISNNLGLSLKPYRTTGNHILVCCQRNGGWSMKGLSVNDWLNNTVATLRSLTDRPIVVRVHPGDKKWRQWFKMPAYPNISLSQRHIKEDLQNAWASVVQVMDSNKNVIYASTMLQGVYISPNQAANWLNLGAPEYLVNAISTSSLYAATEGGAYNCKGTGLAAGHVSDATSGINIHHAIVFSDFGIKTLSIYGDFMMVHPSGIFNFTVVADGHANYTIRNVTIFGGDVTWMDMAIEPGISDPEAEEKSSSGGSLSYCLIAAAASDFGISEWFEMKFLFFGICILIVVIIFARWCKLRYRKNGDFCCLANLEAY